MKYVYIVWEVHAFMMPAVVMGVYSTMNKAETKAGVLQSELLSEQKAEFDSYGQVSGIEYVVQEFTVDAELEKGNQMRRTSFTILRLTVLFLSLGVIVGIYFSGPKHKFKVDDCAAYWVDGKKLTSGGTEKVAAKSSITIIRVNKQNYLVDILRGYEPTEEESSVLQSIELTDQKYERIDCKDIHTVLKYGYTDWY